MTCIHFYVLPLLAARAVLDIDYTVLIHSISEYSHCLDRLIMMCIFDILEPYGATFPYKQWACLLYCKEEVHVVLTLRDSCTELKKQII
ncbi:uncharacterized protein CCOS01_00010 [Colletotrichum costaricense]|uniref:Secreted protein n=1 Tax=Colletotrichum costaricense TaxID=1209916 RepID=A0AAJ0E6S2_9PEZI|nr:uncharacterized protein CCOS01_00010 [Colletotrichum costaricense]KAK1538696.1 hypothetical protein CCOS01_00010 [Colletotrichum costaricense]